MNSLLAPPLPPPLLLLQRRREEGEALGAASTSSAAKVCCPLWLHTHCVSSHTTELCFPILAAVSNPSLRSLSSVGTADVYSWGVTQRSKNFRELSGSCQLRGSFGERNRITNKMLLRTTLASAPPFSISDSKGPTPSWMNAFTFGLAFCNADHWTFTFEGLINSGELPKTLWDLKNRVDSGWLSLNIKWKHTFFLYQQRIFFFN